MPDTRIMKPLLELQKHKNVGIYCRVSSTHAEQLASLSQQVSYFTKMVMVGGGWFCCFLLKIKTIDDVHKAVGNVLLAKLKRNSALKSCNMTLFSLTLNF